MLASSATAAPGLASDPDPGTDALVQSAAQSILAALDYRYQEQVTLARGGALGGGEAADLPGRLGLVELGAAVSFWSFGVSGAAGFERVAEYDLLGGYAHLAAQWRPVALSHARIGGVRAFHWLDPFLAVGARLGGLGIGEDARLRAAMTIGMGLDIGWALAAVHPLITLRYQMDPLTVEIDRAVRDGGPGTPNHFLFFGVGVRTAE